ncbi:hypothetical protein JXQ70_10735 [bacterium]|nr:hypothetical protein [bacterium]
MMQMMKQAGLVVCAFVLFLGMAVPAMSQQMLSPYNTNMTGTFVQVRVHTDGDVHLCYWRGYSLFYLHEVDGVMQPELEVRGSVNGAGFEYPAFAIDVNENAHFAWGLIIPYHYQIVYTMYNAATKEWASPSVPIEDMGWGGNDTRRPFLTACPNGSVFVATESDYRIKWNWRWIDGDWLRASNDVNDTGLFFDDPMEPVLPSLACGSNNRPVCVFSHFNQENLDLGFSQWEDAGYWPEPMRPTLGWQGGITHSTSIAMDSLNQPHFVWLEWRDGGVHYDRIGYNYRTGPNWDNDWAQERYIYYEDAISNVEMAPTPRMAINDRGDILVIFGRLKEISTPIINVHYMFKAFDRDWPDPHQRPPMILESASQAYPDVTVDPSNDFFVMAWENNLPESGGHGTIWFRKLCPYRVDAE